ncbi:MAG: AI-2E family transporter, partial [Gemmatimonadales bacterium]
MKETFLNRAAWGFGLLAGAAVLLFAWFTRDIIVLVFAGILLGVCLRAPAEWLNRRTGLPEPMGVWLVVVVILVLATGAIFLSGNVIARQVDELVRQLPIAVDRLEAQLMQLSWGRTLLTRIPSLGDLIPTDGGGVRRITGLLSSTLWILVSAFLIIFFGLTFALSPRVYTENAISLAPPGGRDRVRKIMREITLSLRWWMLGRLISMAIIGVLTFIGLVILGIPLAGVLALLAALLSFIPNIGPILGAI